LLLTKLKIKIIFKFESEVFMKFSYNFTSIDHYMSSYYMLFFFSKVYALLFKKHYHFLVKFSEKRDKNLLILKPGDQFHK